MSLADFPLAFSSFVPGGSGADRALHDPHSQVRKIERNVIIVIRTDERERKR
jgi:hypothetical protein